MNRKTRGVVCPLNCEVSGGTKWSTFPDMCHKESFEGEVLLIEIQIKERVVFVNRTSGLVSIVNWKLQTS